MNNNQYSSSEIRSSVNGTAPRRWRGYSLDELRTQRIITQARIIVERNSLDSTMSMLKAKQTSRRTITQKVLGALNVIDYSVMGFAVVKKLSSIVRTLRKK